MTSEIGRTRATLSIVKLLAILLTSCRALASFLRNDAQPGPGGPKGNSPVHHLLTRAVGLNANESPGSTSWRLF